MRSPSQRAILVVALLAGLALLATSAPALAKSKRPITGKLSKPGYTVIALARNGKARVAHLRGRRFKIRPPASKVTLHLRDADGVYAGPIVVARRGRRGRRAVVGVKAGARLGSVRVLRGYAKPRRRLRARYIQKGNTARARRGVPIGARVFGRVKSKARGSGGPGRDRDRDGIPGAFDVDDDGDLVLDNFERSSARSAAADPGSGERGPDTPPGGGDQPPPTGSGSFWMFSNFKLQIEDSLNANATAVTDEQIDRTMSRATTLAIEVARGDTVELDCGGLSYCSRGGTGRALTDGGPGRPFPDAFDPDGDGFGTITPGPTGDFQLLTGARASEIGSGDTFVEHVTRGSRVTQIPGVLNYVFSTTPALTTWSEGPNSGTISYPIAPNAPGTPSFPLLVSGSGDVVVTLTFWRPQRKAIPGSGEGSGWVDIGGLNYTVDLPNEPSGGAGSVPGAGPGNCPASTYSTSDPNLTVTGDGLADSATDRPSNPANTLTFSVNLTQCLASAGKSWGSGQSLNADIQARSEFGDNAAQILHFRRR